MKKNKTKSSKIAALGLATALAFGGASAAGAATAATSGTVTSGSSSYKIFNTQRFPSEAMNIRQDSSSPVAEGRYRQYSCYSGTWLGGGTSFLGNNQNRTFSNQPACVRIGMRRNVPQDTNGIGFGSGNTTFNITVTW